MRSIHKNALALSCINEALIKLGQHPLEYIVNYDQSIFRETFSDVDSWETSENLKRDLKIVANEFYRRIKK